MTKTNEGMGARESFVGGGNTCVICSCGRPVWWYIEMPPVCPWCLRELRSESRDTARTTSRSELEDLILAMEVEMRFQDVQKMAKGLGVNPYRKKKMELKLIIFMMKERPIKTVKIYLLFKGLPGLLKKMIFG
jgi:hypothetical protein